MSETGPSRAAQVDALRAGRDVHVTDVSTQRLYEAWAQRDAWHLKQEAVPLVVGQDPAQWSTSPAADALAHAMAVDLGTDVDALVSPLAVRRWAQAHGLRLPQALSRLLDFITSVLPQEAREDVAAEGEILRAQERETLLGAALMLVTKEQAACLDDEGCYSPAKIARLIRARAVLWFPLAPLSLDEAEIAALVARWIAPPSV